MINNNMVKIKNSIFLKDNNDFQNKLIEPIDSSELLEESDECPLPLLEEADENEVEFIRRK
ncbi:7390_t:CDS:2 [Entrophospora sp. SA101]|nr:7390_t:CDS:2 [Entrophospora sp. SA101]